MSFGLIVFGGLFVFVVFGWLMAEITDRFNGRSNG